MLLIRQLTSSFINYQFFPCSITIYWIIKIIEAMRFKREIFEIWCLCVCVWSLEIKGNKNQLPLLYQFSSFKKKIGLYQANVADIYYSIQFFCLFYFIIIGSHISAHFFLFLCTNIFWLRNWELIFNAQCFFL